MLYDKGIIDFIYSAKKFLNMDINLTFYWLETNR